MIGKGEMRPGRGRLMVEMRHCVGDVQMGWLVAWWMQEMGWCPVCDVKDRWRVDEDNNNCRDVSLVMHVYCSYNLSIAVI